MGGQALMSGGSFDYISTADLRRVVDDRENIARMAYELEALGFSDLAASTRRFPLYAGAIIDVLERELAQLQSAWYGVEWWVSCDWSKEQAIEACERARSVKRDGP